ncbi:DNA-directed RNA polymerase subunit P [Candidatus Woesearchaeota archaeon]|nr:DNA-directed RNA polymerase subunit P [Candidatus Woesearchaeota archaeon]
MTQYKCFTCNKKIPQNLLRRRIRCPYCGSKLLFKPRSVVTKVKAR